MEIRTGVSASGISTVTDGVTTVFNATTITITGATVTNLGGGNVGITITGGGGGTVTNVATNATLTGGPITTTGTLGLNLSNPNTWTGNQTFNTNAFTIQDSTDNTKKATFSLANNATGTTAIWNLPTTTSSTTFTLAATSTLTQTFTGATTFSNAVFNLTGTTPRLGTNTAASTIGLGDGATLAATTKTINIGIAGVSTSVTNINVGSSVSGSLGTFQLNSPNVNVATLSAGGLVKAASTTGALSVATAGTDYQAPITLTTTGTSGAATFIGNTLNIPQYTGGGGGTVSSVSSPNGTITVATGTTTPAIDIDLTHANSWSGLQTFTNNNIGTTITDGLVLSNSTAAASGLQQESGSVRWTGQGWKTTATAASQQTDFVAYVLPVQGTTAPTAEWHLGAQINGGGYVDAIKVNNVGTLTSTAGMIGTSFLGSGSSGVVTLASNTVPLSANFNAISTNFSGTTSTARYLFAGGSNINYRVAVGGINATTNLTAGNVAANFLVAGSPVLTSTTTANPWVVQQAIASFGTITAGAGGVLPTNTAMLYIDAASTSGTTANYSIYSAGGISSFNGDVKLSTAGNGLYIKEGSNATMGTGTLVGGTLTVSNAKVTASSRIFLTSEGGTVTNLGNIYISARSAGVSFTVTSSNVLDTQTFIYLIMEPA